MPGRLAPEHGLGVARWWSCHAVVVAEVREMGVQVQMGEMELYRRRRCVHLLNVALWVIGDGLMVGKKLSLDRSWREVRWF